MALSFGPSASALQVLIPSGGRKRKPDRRRTVRVEGTTAGDGVRRLCYCVRHDPRSTSTAAAIVVGRAAGATGNIATAPAQATHGCPAGVIAAVHAAAEQPLTSLGHAMGCSRAVAYNHALRQGHREPYAVAAAAAKRRFVRQTLYLTIRGRSDPCDRPLHRVLSPEQWATEGAGGSGAAAKQLPGSPGGLPVRTVAERYAEMRRSLGSRVTCGKSAIHGWGAFSKLPHGQGAPGSTLPLRGSV